MWVKGLCSSLISRYSSRGRTEASMPSYSSESWTDSENRQNGRCGAEAAIVARSPGCRLSSSLHKTLTRTSALQRFTPTIGEGNRQSPGSGPHPPPSSPLPRWPCSPGTAARPLGASTVGAPTSSLKRRMLPASNDLAGLGMH